jgi:hypothetical protein
LQSVPGWDLATIRELLPFITVNSALSPATEVKNRLRDGEHSLLFRISQVMERSKGFKASPQGVPYPGNPQRFFTRYRYNYKNLLQFGAVGDKDAGEQFFKGVQGKGFDFYSFHLFIRKIGILQNVALGYFTVNMGQGLTQWQGLAFKKSGDITGIKRQGEVLRPYNSAGEFYFHRGIGITVKKKRMEGTVYASIRKLSANLVYDTLTHSDFITSFLASGYHRTVNENADRNNIVQASGGAVAAYCNDKWRLAMNSVYYTFSLPVQKKNEPYNLYAISGSYWFNASVDYSYTRRNLHFFGEAALDKNINAAFINGILVSVDTRVDLSFLLRTISPRYQAMYGNAFTENTYPSNETGFYTGITFRPAQGWVIHAYGDLYRFPWLKYQVDAPGYGKDFLLHVTYTPDKQVELYTRFRSETRTSNAVDNVTVTNYPAWITRKYWRVQSAYKVDRVITLRNRLELSWFYHKNLNQETGFMGFCDIIYKPMLVPCSAVIRVQYFETGGYNSRVYAYENDVLYSYSVPASFGKGFRYYLTFNYVLGKNISLWLRWSQTIYRDVVSIGSGTDEITGTHKSELKWQMRWIF